MEYIIAFNNTDNAVKSERALLEQKIHAIMQPLPSQIHMGCGLCLKIGSCEVKTSLKILAEKGIGEIMIFSSEAKGAQYSYTEINEKIEQPIDTAF